MPIGTIISFMGTIPPENYLACDGTEYNIEDYSALADFFEVQFGTKNNFGGDGTTTFALPDLRGEFLRGTGTNGHENQGSGETVGVHQDSSIIPYMLPHNTSLYISKGDFYNPDSSYGRAVMHESYQSKNTGSPQPIGKMIRPTNTSILYCIKAV